LYPSVQDEGL